MEKRLYYIAVIENLETGEVKAQRFSLPIRSKKEAEKNAFYCFDFIWHNNGWNLVALKETDCRIGVKDLL